MTTSLRKQDELRTISLSCNLSALNEAQRGRRSELAQFLLSEHSDVKELVDGYQLEFPTSQDTFLIISEWTLLERMCCPFISFSLDIDSEDRPIRVKLTGPRGTKEFLRAELEAAHA